MTTIEEQELITVKSRTFLSMAEDDTNDEHSSDEFIEADVDWSLQNSKR